MTTVIFIIIFYKLKKLIHYFAYSKMNVESWCQVERNSNEEWTRAKRKNVENAFESSVFDEGKVGMPSERTEWCTSSKPKETELSKLAKKKHFQQKCEPIISHVASPPGFRAEIIIIYSLYKQWCVYYTLIIFSLHR